jgi:hypothetical protein
MQENNRWMKRRGRRLLRRRTDANVRAFEGWRLYDDLGVEYRDQAGDQVPVDAAHAIAQHGVGVEDGAASV